MLHEIDLRELAELSGPERAFLSLYLHDAAGLDRLAPRLAQVRNLLADQGDELEHFERSLELARGALDGHRSESPSLALFACWALDHVSGYELEAKVPELLRVGTTPYIRPLAELRDEHETFAVVSADNRAARLLLVTAERATEADKVRGDVKNHVKKGGWSQRRYQRRRENELQRYAKEVAASVAAVAAERPFSRLVLLGSQEATAAIRAELGEPLRALLVAAESADLKQGDDALVATARELCAEREREDERALWDRIKGELLAGGLAAAGAADVAAAAAAGRVEAMIVTRDAKLAGRRCRACEALAAGEPERCPACGEEVVAVDLVNQLVALLERTSATAEFVDPIRGLSRVGDVAALLRY